MPPLFPWVSYQDCTAAKTVFPWTTQAGARQTSLPDAASQITDSNKKAFTISVFVSDLRLMTAASQEELSRELSIIRLTNSKQNATFAATWMQLEIIILSEVRKRKTNAI